MNVYVNGETRATAPGATLAQALDAWDIPVKGVAVERNRVIVPRSAYGETVLRPDDRLEIVTFVGGG